MLTLYKQIFSTSHLICNLINIGHTGNQMTIRSIFIQDRITPSIKKQLLSMLAERLSQISYNQHMFNNATVVYQEAMQKSGYHNELKYQHSSSPTIQAKTKKENKKFYGLTPLSVNILKLILELLFFNLLEKHFFFRHRLRKICNKNITFQKQSKKIYHRAIESLLGSHRKWERFSC